MSKDGGVGSDNAVVHSSLSKKGNVTSMSHPKILLEHLEPAYWQ